jgi:nitrogen fixation-related uncharacterized protein
MNGQFKDTEKTKGVIKNGQFKDTEKTKGVIKNGQFKDTGQHKITRNKQERKPKG